MRGQSDYPFHQVADLAIPRVRQPQAGQTRRGVGGDGPRRRIGVGRGDAAEHPRRGEGLVARGAVVVAQPRRAAGGLVVAAEPAQQGEPLAQARPRRVRRRPRLVQQRQRLVRRRQLRLQEPRGLDPVAAPRGDVDRGAVAVRGFVGAVEPLVEAGRLLEQFELLVRRHRLREQPAVLEALGRGEGVVQGSR